ncbi:cytochrome c oxidase subunit VA-domain-containing protein [Myxozyma melibiosi]|uniref:Cytochrome c oxidase subunit 6, mitochondrial n=1 Tax=Myxozyma melibiosi TaxID=54550 RepID=A0ABR1FC41_9ASCO
MASIFRSSSAAAAAVLRRQLPVARQLPIGANRLVLASRARVPCAAVRSYSAHADESYDEFNARFEKEFDEAYDSFEVQRVLTNCFSYDHVPSPAVIVKALTAARRVNDFATAVRVFEAIKLKVPAKHHYEAYLEELAGIREKLGVPLKEELFPESK